ncbi:hypothetical protein Desaci_4156 [Desulfosporosinus acidiphilus SJ4]|uniref:Uncharacterized protein n=1 Tax=Desulfosporosinus acidiphilus (strain DSM 22704 / JCM 16185 / SJ4) TaxID=646529 RepID=I4DB44_DESAJ|nr:hypothetical protein [Desulfosporosinus acidiphilus]AFM43018.1 hypothetical protein Desaci_4156 [Desulfosporosinus acidiphilus SJ4]
MIFILILVFIGIALVEVPGLIRKKYWRELIVFSTFLSFSFIVALLQTIGVKLPNPMRGIDYLIKDILHLSYSQ